jgi:C4-dicarboxylate-specific signal transduction histidine kinase
LRADLEAALPQVLADRVCLQHVLLSLTLNAMDAMEGLEAEQRKVLLRTRRIDDSVVLAVSDAGHGIAAEHLPKLFDAFFTTKKEGLGLGLAIAQSIVEAHNGKISAENHGGSGATFYVALPAMTQA